MRLDKKMKTLTTQIIKFGFVGGISFLIDYSLLIFFTELLNVHYIMSAAISFVVSTIFNYVASMKWVFRSKYADNQAKELIIFVLLSISGLMINEIFMWLLVEKYAIYYLFTKIIVTMIVMVWNFITRKVFLEGK